MIKTEIAINLKKLLFEYEISASELAQSIDIPQPTIHRIIVGKSKQPRNETINKIANYFRIDADKLLSSDLNTNNYSAKNQQQNHFLEIPIMNLENLSNLSDLQSSDLQNNKIDVLISTRDINPKCFALRWHDCSMEPIFNKNNIIIYDPDLLPMDRNYVLVKLVESNTFLFRQFIINGQDQFLRPLNVDLNTMPLKLLGKNDVILGVAIETRREFL